MYDQGKTDYKIAWLCGKPLLNNSWIIADIFNIKRQILKEKYAQLTRFSKVKYARKFSKS